MAANDKIMVVIAMIRYMLDVPIERILYRVKNARMIVINKLTSILPKMRL